MAFCPTMRPAAGSSGGKDRRRGAALAQQAFGRHGAEFRQGGRIENRDPPDVRRGREVENHSEYSEFQVGNTEGEMTEMTNGGNDQ